ncbi:MULTISPECIES: response regulator transcription factor [Microbulbifer]|uniref:response regulator transcription factor n=1 Tax=Microbulbifer TaxID=48073 RepID=UPI001CD75AA0|nr:response regulator transcription factor [Microbulbifer agarilyticus]MCA0899899.1 response regulator transcription factor [Microbulbifer agarilyticus]
MPIKVLLVDDQQLMRDGIRMLLELEDGIELVAEASNGEEAVAAYTRYTPDLVLMDIEMPRMNGIEATKQIKALNPQARIIILTTFGQADYLRNGLLAGAQGFLLKAVSGAELAESIRKVYRGESALDGQSTELLLDSYRALSEAKNSQKKTLLSTREVQILELVALQYSNRDIAVKLQLAEGTVKNYISQVLEKLYVRDRNQAVRVAQEKGLLE